LKKLGNW